MKNITLIVIFSAFFLYSCQSGNKTDMAVEERVENLVKQMTLDEKIAQLSHLAPAIERLGVFPYELNFDNPYGQISFELIVLFLEQ